MQVVRAPSYDALLEAGARFVRAWAEQGEALVIAPAKAAADDLVRAACPGALAGIHRKTLPQAAAALAADTLAGGGLAPAGERLLREAIVARTVDAAMTEGALEYFAPVARTPGFASALAATLEELRLENVAPARLRESDPAGRDLARLLDLYGEELRRRRLVDLADLFSIAAEVASSGSHRLCGMPLLLLDPVLTTAAERALVDALLARAPEAVTLAPGGDAEPHSALDSVQRYLFSTADIPARDADASFRIFSASGEALECVEIARSILAAADQGMQFDQIAVLLRDPNRYQPLIEEAFRRAAIPAWFTRGSRRPDPAGRALLSLLECAAEGLPASRFAEYLSLGQAPANEDEADLATPAHWERLIVDASVIGGKARWERRLNGLAGTFNAQYEAAEDEAEQAFHRRRIVSLDALRDFALPLIERLAALPLRARWGEWLDTMRELAAAALRRPEGVHELLDELQPMAEIGPVELPEVLLVLRSHLRFLRREPGDERYGRVFVSSVEEARGMAFRLVFVPGLSEGTFPRPLFEDPLFGDAPRTGLGLRPRDRDEDEKGLLRLAAACAREVLTLSYARIDLLTGREKVPSFYAFDAMRAARGAPVEVRDFEREAAALTETRIGWPAPSDSCAAIDDAEYDLAVLRPAMEGKACDGLGAYLTAVNERLVRSLRARGRRWRPRWFASDGLVDLDVEALLALEEHRLGRRADSPSALQQFALCPYRFALRAIHQLYPAEAPAPLQRMDPLVRGELYHRAQFVLLRSLRQAGRLPVTAANVDLALAELDRALDAVAAEFAERLAPAIESVWNAEVEALRADLRGWLQELDPDWTPAAFELSFGIEDLEAHDPASVAEPVDVLGLARLRGSIDLVERHPSGALRVTDHKTGAVPSPLPQLVGRGEVLQPILYALAAERILDGRVAFGRLYYSTVRQNYRRIDVPIQDFARERIAQVLRTIDDALDKGFLPAAPREDACRNCDYLPVCGPYEEERIRLKSRPELRPLFELRRMP